MLRCSCRLLPVSSRPPARAAVPPPCPARRLCSQAEGRSLERAAHRAPRRHRDRDGRPHRGCRTWTRARSFASSWLPARRCSASASPTISPSSPSTKLVAQIALASLLLFFGYRLNWIDSLTLDTLLTLFWIVGITNAFNLLDNMDGLCAGIALIAGAALLIGFCRRSARASAPRGALPRAAARARPPGSSSTTSTRRRSSWATAAACSSASALRRSRSSARPTAAAGPSLLSIVAAPVLVLLIPIFDTTLVTVSRLLSGRRPSQGGRDHSSHRLVAIGLSERTAVAVLWTLAAVGGAIGVVAPHARYRASGRRPPAGFLLAMVIFAVYLARVRVYEDADVALLQAGTVTPFVVDFMYKRRVAEVLLDFCLVALALLRRLPAAVRGPGVRSYTSAASCSSLPIVLGAAAGRAVRGRRLSRRVAALRDDGRRRRSRRASSAGRWRSSATIVFCTGSRTTRAACSSSTRRS